MSVLDHRIDVLVDSGVRVPQAVLERLEIAYERLQDPAHWTQGANARNNIGLAVGPNAHGIVTVCGRGAAMTGATETHTMRAALTLIDTHAYERLNKSQKLCDADTDTFGMMATLNDQTSLPKERVHREVLDVYSTVITRLRLAMMKAGKGQ